METRITKRPMVVEDLIALLVDYNLDYRHIDEQMRRRGHEWEDGGAMKAWKRWPELREDVRSARAIAIRESGAEKVRSIRTYVEAERAVKVDADGEERPDHKIRMEASDRLLKLQGEDTTGASRTNINVSGTGDNKILIITSGGRAVEDMV